MSSDSPSHPCPACGFLVFDEPPGSYVICDICDWEDDAVQLANPCSAGGANSISLDEAQQLAVRQHPPGTTEAEGVARDPVWRPLLGSERAWEQRAIELSGSPWPNKATETYYWRDPWQTVHTMTDYYDGPRGGIADFEGKPHHFESTWNDLEDEYADVYILRPIDERTVELALEDWEIWLRWEHASQAGAAQPDTHPALPEDQERHLAIEQALAGKLPPAGDGVRVTAKFDALPRPAGRVGWIGLRVRWRREGVS